MWFFHMHYYQVNGQGGWGGGSIEAYTPRTTRSLNSVRFAKCILSAYLTLRRSRQSRALNGRDCQIEPSSKGRRSPVRHRPGVNHGFDLCDRDEENGEDAAATRGTSQNTVSVNRREKKKEKTKEKTKGPVLPTMQLHHDSRVGTMASS